MWKGVKCKSNLPIQIIEIYLHVLQGRASSKRIGRRHMFPPTVLSTRAAGLYRFMYFFSICFLHIFAHAKNLWVGIVVINLPSINIPPVASNNTWGDSVDTQSGYIYSQPRKWKCGVIYAFFRNFISSSSRTGVQVYEIEMDLYIHGQPLRKDITFYIFYMRSCFGD